MIDNRVKILSDLKKCAKEIGFFPMEISQNDLDCFWIRVEPKDPQGKFVFVQRYDLDDDSFIELLKTVAKFEERKLELDKDVEND